MSEAENILLLAKAREILLIDIDRHSPAGARQQNKSYVATMETLIDEALANNEEPLPILADDADSVTRNAHAYVTSRMGRAYTQAASAEPYEQLKLMLRRTSELGQACETISWARQTKASPEVTDTSFEDAEAAMQLFSQRIEADPILASWREEKDASGLSSFDKRNIELTRDDLRAASVFTEEFVKERSIAATASERIWEENKPKSDYAAWQPHLEKIVQFARKEGELLGKEFGMTPYQALLDRFNPGLSNDTVNNVFGELRAKLPGLIKKAVEEQNKASAPIAFPKVPAEVQARIARRVMKDMGLTDDHMRLDVSSHPFCCGQWDDVRITTRYEDNPVSGVMSVVHEAGHALYSHKLPREWLGQPVGEAQSMWIHESQSLFWEISVGSSREFMQYLSRIFKEELPKDGIDISSGAFEPENMYRIATQVKPSLIRVDADALTYPLHIILRHELEQKLIDGSLEPKDLPAAWNAAIKDYLGIEVPDNKHGCMQDIHWSDGSIGYFPAYSFGALAAAQLMEKAKEEIPGIKDLIAKGNFAPISAWLEEKIHRHGSLYTGEELIEKATGKPLSAEAWLKQAEARHLASKALSPS